MFNNGNYYRLSELGEFKGGISNLNKQKYGKGVLFINYKDVFDNWFISKNINLQFYDATIKDKQKYNLKYGDVLFTASSEIMSEICISSVFLIKKEAIFNGFCKRYRYNQEILLPKYACYLFRSNSFRKEVVKICTGYTRYNISQKYLEKVKIWVPTCIEQKRIIDIIEPLEKLLECNDLLKQQIQNFIRLLPSTKKHFYLKDIAKIIKNPKNNIQQLSAKVLLRQDCFIQELEKVNTYKTNSFFAPEGTLLINSIRTYLRKFAILPVDADVNGTIIQLKVKSNYISVIHNFLNEHFWQQAIIKSYGTKMPVLSADILMNNIPFFYVENRFESIELIKLLKILNVLTLKTRALLNRFIPLLII